MRKINNEIQLKISGLHANAMATHLLIVIKNTLSGKEEAEIDQRILNTLTNLDKAYAKLSEIGEKQDDETPKSVHFTIAEAEAIIQAFIDKEFKKAALKDPYYEKYAYSDYFQHVFSKYLKEISTGYVLTLAA